MFNIQRTQEAEKLYQSMLKRFKQSKKVWVGYAHYLMKIGRKEEARALLQRSLKSLREHKRKIITSQLIYYSCAFQSVWIAVM